MKAIKTVNNINNSYCSYMTNALETTRISCKQDHFLINNIFIKIIYCHLHNFINSPSDGLSDLISIQGQVNKISGCAQLIGEYSLHREQ